MIAIKITADILQLLAREHRPLGVNEISRIIKVNPATTHRILSELKTADLVQQDPATKRYQLGFGLTVLARAVERQTDIFQLALPVMQELRDELGETVALCVRRHLRRVYVGQAQGFGQLQFSAPIGDQLPLYLGSAGKAFLGYIDAGEVARVRQVALEAGVSWDKVLDGINCLKRDGYLWSFGELTPGTFSCAAPILGPRLEVPGVLVVNGPIHRHTPEGEERIGVRLREAVNGLSAMLGGPGAEARNRPAEGDAVE